MQTQNQTLTVIIEKLKQKNIELQKPYAERVIAQTKPRKIIYNLR